VGVGTDRKRAPLARETLVWLSPERKAAIEVEIRHVYGLRTRLRGSQFVRDPARGARALVHTFDAVGRDRGTCFAWFEGVTSAGSALVLVLRTEAIPDEAAALRAYRRPEVQ
jgi:hypothetical protein